MKYIPPADMGLNLIYADAHLLVVNKPSGLLSVPGRGVDKMDCLISRVQREYADALIVHRLDMATSGLLVLARGSECHRALSLQFQQRQVEKEYVAVVHGLVPEQYGEIDLPLYTDWPNRPRQQVDFVHGKPSQTHYKVLDRDRVSQRSRLSLTPVTGRTHQLRVHANHIGHPIVGDLLYAPHELAAEEARLLLHARCLSLRHPDTSEMLTFYQDAEF